MKLQKLLPALCSIGLLVLVWQVSVALSRDSLIPGPWPVVLGIVELAKKGLLLKYIVASLFRVTWGYLAGVLIGVPFGLALGWYHRGERALNPLLQILRPVSPLAWIPISILWFGAGDLSAVYLIFMASFLPMTVTAVNAVRNIAPVHLNAG